MNAYRQDVSQRREHTVGVGQGEYPAERERGDVGVAVDHAAAMASEREAIALCEALRRQGEYCFPRRAGDSSEN